jgi:hypothetical protein
MTMATPHLPIPRVVYRRGWAQILNVSTKSIDRYRASGLLPVPIRVIGKRPVWTQSQVLTWLVGETANPFLS